MSEIICPYCCKRFQPTQMVFRLNQSLTEKKDGEEEERSMWDTPGRLSGKEKVIDEKLKQYYMNFENMDERTAENNASFDAETIDIDFVNMMDDITEYNQKMYSERQFVLELTYKGQRLTERLCPYCHNELIPNAGLYDMKIIAMYGDTNAGKTVYLNVLEAVLRGDPRLNASDNCAFQGSMFYQGNDMEYQIHSQNYDLLMEKHRLPEATKGGHVVRPQVFRYSYNTADRPTEDKNLLIVFRDIPGEDTRSSEKMHRYGFYLKNADGIIVLLNAKKLTRIAPMLRSDGNTVGSPAVAQALSNLADLLAAVTGGEKISIPTAVVLAQADILEMVFRDENRELYDKITNVDGPKDAHYSYFNRRVTEELNESVKKILENLRETNTILNPVSKCFSRYCYFAVSALGEEPEARTDEAGGEYQIVQEIRPMRVAEPLYWILSKLNCIPYYHVERWKKGRNRQCEVSIFYYEKERNGLAQKRCEEKKEAQGIKRPHFGAKWELEYANDRI